MQLTNMRYRTFTFPQNPETLKVKKASSVQQTPLLSGCCETDETYTTPAEITVSGYFFGDGALSAAHTLSSLFKNGEAGLLILPDGRRFLARLTAFTYSLTASEGGVSYTASFLEDVAFLLPSPAFTIARHGENAFLIARRCRVEVDDIMRLNPAFITPFSIPEGAKVVLK